MSNLSIVIPVTDRHEFTDRCVQRLIDYAWNDNNDIIVIDNGSITPYFPQYDQVRVLRNEVNTGYFPSIVQGLLAAQNNIVLTQHNDVLIQEEYYDQRILDEFENDSKLGIAGFFGGRGVAENGGRDHAESNMVGFDWGMPGHLHGHIQEETHPSVVFDSLAMIYNKDIFFKVFSKNEIDNIPIHHWPDRIVTLSIVMAGYHGLTIGVAFDHYGGATSVANVEFDKLTARWVKEKGLPIEENPDYTLYKYGERMFQSKFRGKFPVRVNKDFSLTFAGKGRDLSDA
jgi:glycosyltransferase involved in cell wall biosynthesis